MHADALVDPPGDDRTERDELAVGEVGQPGRAVDQRQPDRGDGDDQAELDAVGDRLRQPVPPAVDLALRLAQEVVEDLPLLGADGHDQLGLRLVTELHVLGQRVLVQAHGVVTRPRERDLELTIGVGGGRTDLGTARVDDRQLDTLTRARG